MTTKDRLVSALGETNEADRLFALLRQRIAAGEWQVDSPLPTVRALSREFRVSPHTIQRVFGKLQTLGLIECRRGRGTLVKAQASRVLRTAARPGMQAIVIRSTPPRQGIGHATSTSWELVVMSALDSALHSAGLQSVSCHDSADITDPCAAADAIAQQIDRMREPPIGAVLMPVDHLEPIIELLDCRGVAWVTVNRSAPGVCHNFVSSDFEGGGRRAGLCFARMGLRRVALIGPDLGVYTSWREVFNGFIDGYASTGMPLAGIRVIGTAPNDDEEQAYKIVRGLLAAADRPQLILAARDLFALAALRACRDAGVAVPDEINIVGSTGLELSKFTSPPLSVIAQRMDRLGEEAAALLNEMIQAQAPRAPGRLIEMPLLLRGSVRVPPELAQELRANATTDIPNTPRKPGGVE